jgi:hypothetical protein
MDYILPLLIIVGGILAISALIVAKKPEAKQLIDKLTPYQALIGIVMLAWGVISLIRGLKGISFAFKFVPGFTVITLAMVASSILLGFMFGMPQIAKWAPGESNAEVKALELSRKLAPYQVVLGLIGIGSALIFIVVRAGIIKPF